MSKPKVWTLYILERTQVSATSLHNFEEKIFACTKFGESTALVKFLKFNVCQTFAVLQKFLSTAQDQCLMSRSWFGLDSRLMSNRLRIFLRPYTWCTRDLWTQTPLWCNCIGNLASKYKCHLRSYYQGCKMMVAQNRLIRVFLPRITGCLPSSHHLHKCATHKITLAVFS